MTSLNLVSKAYKGTFNYRNNAKNENIYVSLAAGLVSNGPVHIFSTWTKNAAGYEKAPVVGIGHLTFKDSDKHLFVVEDADYYTWKGKVLDGGQRIVLGIWYGNEQEARSETIVELIGNVTSDLDFK